MPILGASASSIKPVPVAPTIGTATNVGASRAHNNGAATVTFTAPNSKLPISSYTVTSSPGSYTGTGSSSPITVAGLQSATAYTFTVTATSSAGTSAASSASNSITATTVPQAPTIGSATAGGSSATVTYTAGANGGAAVSVFTATSSPGGFTGTGASPITVSGLSNGTAYTFTVTATNANGTSTASSASNSVTPAVPSLSTWSNVGSYPIAMAYTSSDTSSTRLWSAGGSVAGSPSVTAASYYSTDGVTWTSNALPAARGQAQGVWDGTYFQQFGGESSAGVETATTYYTTGSGWTAGTNIPSAYNALGGAWAVGGTVAINNFFGTQTWYRTGTGAWTVGTSAPNKAGRSGFGSGQTAGPNDRSVAYGYVGPNSSTASDFAVFSQSSANGAWSTFIDSAAYAAQRPNMAWANGFLFTYGGDNNSFVMFTSCYRTTGSSWSVQNSLPVGVGNWAGSGGIGNDIYVWGGANSSGTPRTQTVYKATQN